MLLVIDPANTKPIYQQIIDQVMARIAEGSLKAGDHLPVAKDLAAALGVNRNTVLQAYRHLRDGAVIELRRSRGAIVLAPQTPNAAVPASVEKLIDALAATCNDHAISAETVINELRKRGLQ